MNFGEYIIYVDESGDHGLKSIDPNYPVFVLAFCIFEKNNYAHEIAPKLQAFKFRWFGHDSIILHEHEIRKQKPPFNFLKPQIVRDQFLEELNKIFGETQMTIISSVIRKDHLKKNYSSPANPYELALLFCMERLVRFLQERGESGKQAHIIFERRGRREDADLELEFRRICDTKSRTDKAWGNLEICFVDKKANSTGLQMADLVARPIGLNAIRPKQPNRAFEIIKPRIRASESGKIMGWGLKHFP
ncbi:DUF3800 domain-containing protein [Pyruvatibacter mobilis]|uniref:DUF3800 domain-containing protein n=1 Tax=Pyruvatibacter mobilis TaxID=1712261 RepID=A0A845Q9H1_9HYPH|nr:DUF3800 domain-containing protein [Pyruvatibacter mobilis]NBG95124.1 DUF3800 domain-containing protein [Pyruvatibacter mobilis]QJD76309.1 DUF3800 domain-containing protein [Pyruvatibacter mobilis]GGD23039.1 3-deoxy-D-manno-octulosonic acid transferase [Pyruvatibacter mobilis]